MSKEITKNPATTSEKNADPVSLPMAKGVTQKQLDAWKAEHGKIATLIVGDKVGYVKKPTRQTLSYASQAGAKDPLAFNEIILKQCWLGGDEELMTDTDLFMSVSPTISQLINIQEAKLVFI